MTAQTTSPKALYKLQSRLDRLQARDDHNRAKHKMPVATGGNPQIMIFLDLSGRPHAEAAGMGSAPRAKIDLPADFADRNPELIRELRTRQMVQTMRPVTTPTRRADSEAERQERMDQARRERVAKWNAWIDGLPEAERAHQIAKRDAALDRAKEADLDRARRVYNMTAQGHSLDLANRVVTDPKRRPRKRLQTTNGQMVSPQSGKTTTTKQKTFDPKLVVRITL